MHKKFFSKKFFWPQKSRKTWFFGPKNREKIAESKNFGRKKFFWSESIQNVLKRILKRKSQNQNFFPLQNFSWDFVFFGQDDQNSEKMAKSKNFCRKIFFAGIDSECYETYFKTKISKSKIFPITNFIPGT